MSENSLKLKIAHLYPDILQGCCDEANIGALIYRAKMRNIDVSCDKILSSSKVNLANYDFFYIDGSNIDKINLAAKYLKINASSFRAAHDANVPILAVNLGYVLLGKKYQLQNTVEQSGLGIFNTSSYQTDERYYSKICGVCSFLNVDASKKSELSNIVGFENHVMATKLNDKKDAFLILKAGKGNNFEKTEGAVNKNAIGTYITSALLAQNPHLCDYLLYRTLRAKYKTNISLNGLCDDIEWFSHKYLYARMKS